MATSGTYNFNPSLGDLGLDAFARLQIRGGQLTAEHMYSLRREANLLLSTWANKGPNLWVIDLQTLTLTLAAGATYTLPAETVALFEVYITTSGGDRILMPVSRSDYASFPDKTSTGDPNVYWFNRQATPQITVWPPPSGTFTMKYYRMRQVQDATLAGGTQVEIPYRWIDAFVAGMAHRMSRIYAPQLEQQRKADYDEAYATAAAEDTENVPMYITPGLGGYYR